MMSPPPAVPAYKASHPALLRPLPDFNSVVRVVIDHHQILADDARDAESARPIARLKKRKAGIEIRECARLVEQRSAPGEIALGCFTLPILLHAVLAVIRVVVFEGVVSGEAVLPVDHRRWRVTAREVE